MFSLPQFWAHELTLYTYYNNNFLVQLQIYFPHSFTGELETPINKQKIIIIIYENV